MDRKLFTAIEVALIGGLILAVLYWGGVFNPRPAPASDTPFPTLTAIISKPTATSSRTPVPTRIPRPTIVPSITPTNPALLPPSGLIAFETTRDGNTEIYIMNADGSNQTNLTNNPAEDYQFSWSSDGTQIAFLSTRTGWLEVFVMAPDGSNPRQISRSDHTNTAYSIPLVWSPDGRYVMAFKYMVWAGAVGGYRETLDVIATDGSGARTIYDSEDVFLRDPSWSPDNRHITIIISNRFDQSCKTYIAEFTTGPIEFKPFIDLCDTFAWSPDGRLIAYMEGTDIHVITQDGQEVTQLSDITGNEGFNVSDWSPDGLHVLFNTGMGVTAAISLDGSRLERLMLPSGSNTSWSPDSQWLVFAIPQEGPLQGQVGIVNLYKPDERIFLTEGNDNYRPQWQPRIAEEAVP